MRPGRRLEWPAQRAPDDLADRVVRAALAERASSAEPAWAAPAQTVGRDDVRPRPRSFLALAWLVAAAFAMTTVVAITALVRVRSAKREADQRAALLLQANTQQVRELQRQMEEASQRVEDLRAQLSTATSETQRAELERQLEAEAKRNAMVRAAGAGGEGAKPRAKPACNCQPGDALCSCL